MDFLMIIGIIIAAVPALLYLFGLCVPAAFTIWEQLSYWFEFDCHDNLYLYPVKSVLTWIFGFPGTIFGIALWIVAHIPKLLINLVERLFR